MAKEVLLAAVIAPQGLKGAVKAKLFTATPDSLMRYPVLHDGHGRRFSVTAFRSVKPGEAVMSFQGIESREAAEALKGAGLYVAREELPEAGKEEFYHADLIGLEALDEAGRVIGKLAAIHNFGAGDVIEITRPDGDNVLLAFTRETVPVIDIEAGRVVVAVPEGTEDNDHVE